LLIQESKEGDFFKMNKKLLKDGTTLILDSYPKYHETRSILDRLTRKEVYSLGLKEKVGDCEILVYSGSTRLILNRLYFDLDFFLKLYNHISNKNDFTKVETFLKNISSIKDGKVRLEKKGFL
jgi:hypothetical protein